MQTDFLTTSKSLFTYYRSLAEKAIAQIDDAALHWSKDDDNNSIAVIMQHLAGNMLSRWTDFLASDGEKSWRERDAEFIDAKQSRAELMNYWKRGWDTLLATLDTLHAADLERIVYIRNEGHTVMDAIMRQLAHYADHCGQIILLAKMLASEWQSLSIPKNKSADFNQQLFSETKNIRDFTVAASQFSANIKEEE